LAACPVGSQIPIIRSIPMRTGYPEGCVVPHDSTIRGFSRHTLAITGSGESHPIGSVRIYGTPCPPEGARGTPQTHSENGTGTIARSLTPERAGVYTIIRTMITNKRRRTLQRPHDQSQSIGPVRICAGRCQTAREQSSTSRPTSVLKTVRVRFDGASHRPRGGNGQRRRAATTS